MSGKGTRLSTSIPGGIFGNIICIIYLCSHKLIKQTHMTKWRVDYKERGSDRIRTTYHTGTLSKEEVVSFFGLDKSDVSWYEITEVEE